MSFLDRFKPKKEGSLGKDKKPKHVVVDTKKKSEEAKKQQFAAVPAGGKAEQPPKKAATKSAAPAPVAKRPTGSTGDAYRILLRAIVSEKSSRLNQNRQYVFMVAADANKISVAAAVAKLYGVKPVAVNIINVGGKALRYGRTEGRTKDWKKAVVTLKSGDSISVTA